MSGTPGPPPNGGRPSKGSKVIGEEKRTVHGPVEVPVAGLPKYGLASTSKGPSAVHRPVHGGGNWEDGELVPACAQREVDRQQARDGHEYVQEWRLVLVRKRIPFEAYSLCRNPMCFRHVEVIEEP